MEQTAKVIEEVKESSNVQDFTKNMVDVLSNSTNPKHRNSKFLKFLNKLNYGAYSLENDKLIKNQDKITEFRAIETQRRNDDMLRQIKENKPVQSSEELFKDILNGEKDLDENEYDNLMQEWMQDANQMNRMEEMMQEWGKSWDKQM